MNSNKHRITSAIILAAGRGTRMRELTDNCPKPLLKLNGKCLIDYHIQGLLAAGIERIVINCAYLAQQIQDHAQSYIEQGHDIRLSVEPQALETAGGIKQAWTLLNCEKALVVNADIWSNVDYFKLVNQVSTLDAHLWLVRNPKHNQGGDFDIVDGLVRDHPRFTFSGIGIYRKQVFDGLQSGPLALAPVLRQLMHRRRVTGSLLVDDWTDVGTPERLHQLEKTLMAVN